MMCRLLALPSCIFHIMPLDAYVEGGRRARQNITAEQLINIGDAQGNCTKLGAMAPIDLKTKHDMMEFPKTSKPSLRKWLFDVPGEEKAKMQQLLGLEEKTSTHQDPSTILSIVPMSSAPTSKLEAQLTIALQTIRSHLNLAAPSRGI